MLETSVFKVILQNISYTYFLEFFISFGPNLAFKWFYIDQDKAKFPSDMFFVFKVFRYIRIFETENKIKEILDYYSKEWTVFEIKKV